jgi:predicted O-methyltransferase YrrM
MRPSYSCILERREQIIAAEIGVNYGLNAISMLRSTPRLKLYLIDKDDYSYHTTFSQWNGRVVTIIKDSKEAAVSFVNGFFDYVYIDANHEYEDCKYDLIVWYPKVAIGGILAGHDYGTEEGVTNAVDEFVKGFGLTLFTQQAEPDSKVKDWWVYKFR